MLKSELLSVLQEEIRRHDFSYFIDEPPGVARVGRGVCVPDCSSCSNMASATGSASTASRDFRSTPVLHCPPKFCVGIA
jgi:hypothetical protein